VRHCSGEQRGREGRGSVALGAPSPWLGPSMVNGNHARFSHLRCRASGREGRGSMVETLGGRCPVALHVAPVHTRARPTCVSTYIPTPPHPTSPHPTPQRKPRHGWQGSSRRPQQRALPRTLGTRSAVACVGVCQYVGVGECAARGCGCGCGCGWRVAGEVGGGWEGGREHLVLQRTHPPRMHNPHRPAYALPLPCPAHS
jgi:hypothetical protein